ncbi:unnamed protein product [Linum tenue]|uniref:LisH domain-containing protein n=1 Tax=Linum tenue TaxID=586396 RepID=A0AAV0M9E3_9ROSI|nr:unnamed protein product [Linum tenue]
MCHLPLTKTKQAYASSLLSALSLPRNNPLSAFFVSFRSFIRNKKKSKLNHHFISLGSNLTATALEQERGKRASERERRKMDDYTREMMDLKTLVTRTLEKKGVLAKIRAELRASVFEAIEEEDRVVENEEGLPPALLGSCNDRAKQLHASPSGRLLTALMCEYLDWAELNHTLKVYLPECNLQKDAWKAELKEFSSKNGYDLNRNGDSGPLLLDVLEGFLKYENLTQGRGSGRRVSENESLSNLDSRNVRRPSSSSVAGGIPPLGRPGASSSSDRRAGSSISGGYRKDDYNWRYDGDEIPEEVNRASAALENLQLDRKARNLTSSWRSAGDGMSDDDGRADHI